MVAEDNGGAAEPVKPPPFAVIERVFDPETVRLLYTRGIDDGWRCLEVGGGGGSIAKWLCQRVGSLGRVVVTDLDTRYLKEIDEQNLEIDTHDIVTDPVPEGVFHLVHARLVLGEIVERERALKQMATTLRSGGWIVIEELDQSSLAPDTGDQTADALFAKVRDAIAVVMTVRGFDPDYGRHVFRQLRDLGLVDVVARGGSYIQPGGSPGAELLQVQLNSFRDELLSQHLLTSGEIEQYEALLKNPDLLFMSATLVTTWARRPSAY